MRGISIMYAVPRGFCCGFGSRRVDAARLGLVIGARRYCLRREGHRSGRWKSAGALHHSGQQLLGLGDCRRFCLGRHSRRCLISVGDDAGSQAACLPGSVHLHACPGRRVDPNATGPRVSLARHAGAACARFVPARLVRARGPRSGHPSGAHPDAGARLPPVTVTRPCAIAGGPGARAACRDDRCETHVVIRRPSRPRKPPAIHSGVVGALLHARCRRTALLCQLKIQRCSKSVAALADADIIMLAPSNPVVDRRHLAVPGIRAALRTAHRSSAARRSSAKAVARAWPIRAFQFIRVRSRPLWAGATARGCATRDMLDCWLVHDGDHAEMTG